MAREVTSVQGLVGAGGHHVAQQAHLRSQLSSEPGCLAQPDADGDPPAADGHVMGSFRGEAAAFTVGRQTDQDPSLAGVVDRRD
ncbi:MAG: hypothetical protein M3415_01060 [Actinomycetota bacterium]|nr:hypothetical protein [Actinomycetota bacterium]